MARKQLIVVVTYAVLALAVVGWGWLLTHPFERSVDPVDDDISRWFADQRTPWLDPVAQVGTVLGETVVGLAIGAVVAVVAGLALRSLLPAVLLGLADAGAGGIYWLGSHADPRDRPPVPLLDSGLVPDRSFPSGHVGTAVAVYGGTAVLLWLWQRRHGGPRGAARMVVPLLAGLPLFVAASRLYEGAHHLTDVGTTLVYGSVWLAVLVALVLPGAARQEVPVPRSARGHTDTPVPHG